MFVHNVRYGFATNSSSSHSIVLLKNKKKAKENYSSDFGWEFFTCISENAKLQYLGQTLIYNLTKVRYFG
jgi:hypothetical protein